MQKNRNKFACFLMLALWLASFLMAQNSFAYDMPTSMPITVSADGTVCPSANKGLVIKIIPCIRDTVIYATTQMFTPITKIVARIVTVMSTLAIVFWGIKIMLGNTRAITRDGMILAIKIGVVGMFASQYMLLFPKMLNIMEGLINIVAKPATTMIWKHTSCNISFSGSDAKIMEVFGAVDCYLNSFIGGIFNTIDVQHGMVGFLFSLLFSNPAGFFMGAIGLGLVVLSIITIAKTIYIFLQAFIAFALMSIIAPFFVPLILFKSTEKYFKEWMEETISFIVQPVIAIGYLSMFLMAFDASIFHGKQSLYYSIVGPAANDGNVDFKIGTWLDSNGVYAEKSLNDKGNNINPKGVKTSLGNDTAFDKGIQTTIGQHPECKGSMTTNCVKMTTVSAMSDSMGFGEIGGVANKALNFFKTDTPIQTLNWAKLSKKADPTGCAAVNCTNEDATGADREAIDKYLTSRKIKVFLTLIMSLVAVFVFYKLLDQIPFIGSGFASEIQNRLTLGKSNAPKQSSSKGGGK